MRSTGRREHDCDRCDMPGGVKTYANQVSMPLNGKVQCIDYCIHRIVAALNAGGTLTVASCCGHEKMPGIISLEDGRVLVIFEDQSVIDNWCDIDWSELTRKD